MNDTGKLLFNIDDYALTDSALDTGVFCFTKGKRGNLCLTDDEDLVMLFDSKDDLIYYLECNYNLDYDDVLSKIIVYYHLLSERDDSYIDVIEEDLEYDMDLHTNYFNNDGEIIYI